MNKLTQALIVTVLRSLVESVREQPRRVLFKGMADYFTIFQEYVTEQKLSWEIKATQQGAEIVRSRNDPAVETLVVFYQEEVKERESLNAFCQFNEDAVAEGLLALVLDKGVASETYTKEETEKLDLLLGPAKPSPERLAAFLLAGKANVGEALPLLGLFRDPELNYGVRQNTWQARLNDNYQTAVLRWRDFLDKAQRPKYALQLSGSRPSLLKEAATNPGLKGQVLKMVTLAEALTILNPPSRQVEKLMNVGLGRLEAQNLLDQVKAGKIDPLIPSAEFPELPEEAKKILKPLYKPRVEKDNSEGLPEVDGKPRRVGCCLEGLLQLTLEEGPLPPHLILERIEPPCPDQKVELRLEKEGWRPTLDGEAIRSLSTAPKASELIFKVSSPLKKSASLIHFSLANLAGHLEGFQECWPEEDFWKQAVELYPESRDRWDNLREHLNEIRTIVDPDWRIPPEEEIPSQEALTPSTSSDNNSIYLVFDLLYLAHRQVFEAFLDAWIAVATLPWEASEKRLINISPGKWRRIFEVLLNLGIASKRDGSWALLPFHPLRLTWYREIFSHIESWLSNATSTAEPLLFDPAVMSEQLIPIDRPRALFRPGTRLVEASRAFQPLFFSIFVPASQHQPSRAPLYRAQQKIDQFGRMWPFSLSRFHLAFQPKDGDEVLGLVTRLAENQQEMAFRIQAVVSDPRMQTAFDRYLLSTGEDTSDLLTQEYHEHLYPRLDYTKVRRLEEMGTVAPTVTAHASLLVDAFREDDHKFEHNVGELLPHWPKFQELVKSGTSGGWEELKKVHSFAPPFHSEPLAENQRRVIFTPLKEKPEYLRMLADTLFSWIEKDDDRNPFPAEGVAYFELVSWDASALAQAHNGADWVILFDRHLDKNLFQQQPFQDISLIDFYPQLPGGYKLSVSSGRKEAVAWQLRQVLRQFDLDMDGLPQQIIDSLKVFAGGLLLKTLGGGSLAQELLGLYATFQQLKADSLFIPTQDWLIPLDNYQSWFGRRTQSGRRADLLVVRRYDQQTLEMIAVESKWYSRAVDSGFVKDEFGEDGQLWVAVKNLSELFDPQQPRIDRFYWQETLSTLLDEAPDSLKDICKATNWQLQVDGLVYVHQYREKDNNNLNQREEKLNQEIRQIIADPKAPKFSRGPHFQRLRLISYPNLVALFK